MQSRYFKSWTGCPHAIRFQIAQLNFYQVPVEVKFSHHCTVSGAKSGRTPEVIRSSEDLVGIDTVATGTVHRPAWKISK
jgi:hypothetical protein